MPQHPDANGPITYKVRIRGRLDEEWSDWLDTVAITYDSGVTTLTGPLADQAALRGILTRIWDLNLTLISVQRIEADSEEEHENA
jgi:hypothetical protein